MQLALDFDEHVIRTVHCVQMQGRSRGRGLVSHERRPPETLRWQEAQMARRVRRRQVDRSDSAYRALENRTQRRVSLWSGGRTSQLREERLLDRLKGVLEGLRESLSGKAEQAYGERDAAQKGMDKRAADYAEGEGHAYGVAEGEIRDAQKRADGE
jgi:hypothetical protein